MSVSSTYTFYSMFYIYHTCTILILYIHILTLYILTYTILYTIYTILYGLGISDVLGQVFGISSLVCVSTLTVVVATLFPHYIGSASKSGGVLGVIIMQFFFAVTGAQVN